MSGGGLFRAADAEQVDSPPHLIRLLADGTDTGMSFSVIRVDLRPGFDGAAPHTHSGFAELLYVVDGVVEVLWAALGAGFHLHAHATPPRWETIPQPHGLRRITKLSETLTSAGAA